MLQAFKNYIESNSLFRKEDRILVAVSGGVDSTLLCHLLFECGFDFGMAHCNFKLRNEDADDDAIFVKALANRFEVFYSEIEFDTAKIAMERKTSIQIVARDLRYEWLESIRQQQKFDWIATAHHLNDSIETVLYNLTKGTGIRGLHGILPKNGRIIRPLSFAQRVEIEAFADKQNILFRTDVSNASDKYSRNLIRNQVIPKLKEINTSLESTFADNIQRFQEVEKLYDWAVDFWKNKIFNEENGTIKIATSDFENIPALSTVLYEILLPFGFNGRQIQQLMANYKTYSGRKIYSENFELLVNRQYWIIRTIENEKGLERWIDEKSDTINLGEQLSLSIDYVEDQNFEFLKDRNIGYFDADQFVFPLKLRRWKLGDRFQPFGMKGKHKKVSDIFSNAKLSLFEKEQVWILESNGNIVWVVGMRSDERYKVTEKTKRIMVARLN